MGETRKCWHCGGVMTKGKNSNWACVENGCDLVTARPVGTSYHTPIKDSDCGRSIGEGMRRFPTTGMNNR